MPFSAINNSVRLLYFIGYYQFHASFWYRLYNLKSLFLALQILAVKILRFALKTSMY